MAAVSGIEWTDATWNPVTGCSKVSAGCRNCYAERLARRLKAMGHPRYKNGFAVTPNRDMLEQPLLWRRPRTIFVNSMSDLFHESVPQSFIEEVLAVIHSAKWHNFQVLTKRSARLRDLAPLVKWPANLWIGVSVESERYVSRIYDLCSVPAVVRFLSLEPLLGPLHRLPLEGIDWVIVGGESGPRARPMSSVWVRAIRDRCADAGVPFFFKQWGGVRRAKAGRLLDGRTWDEMPTMGAHAAASDRCGK